MADLMLVLMIIGAVNTITIVLVLTMILFGMRYLSRFQIKH